MATKIFDLIANLGWKTDDKGLEKFEKDAKKATKNVENLSASTKKSELNFKKLSAQSARFDKFEAGLKKIATGFKNVAIAAAAMGTAAVTAIGVSTVEANKQTTQNNRMARTIGITAENYTALGNVFKALGFEQEKVVDTFDEMNKKIGELKADPKKTSGLTEGLAALNLNLKEFIKLDAEQQYNKVWDAATNLTDQQKAASAVDKIFAGDASKLLVALRATGTTMEDLSKKQKDLNFLTDKGRSGAEKFTLSFEALGTIIGSIKDQFFGLLGDALKPLIDELSNFILKNKAVIELKMEKWVENLGEMFKSLGLFIKKAWEYLTSEKFKKDLDDTIYLIKKLSGYVGDLIKGLEKLAKLQEGAGFSGTGKYLKDKFDFGPDKETDNYWERFWQGPPEAQSSGGAGLKDVGKNLGIPTIKLDEKPFDSLTTASESLNKATRNLNDSINSPFKSLSSPAPIVQKISGVIPQQSGQMLTSSVDARSNINIKNDYTIAISGAEDGKKVGRQFVNELKAVTEMQRKMGIDLPETESLKIKQRKTKINDFIRENNPTGIDH